MKRNQDLFAAVAATFFAASTCADASPAAQQKIASVQYLVGTWNCSHTVGTFAGTYTTTYAKYFAIRMTDTGDSGWSWKYVSFFKTQQP